ncbi:MAG: rod shape-determining protein [bacterium]|nr:rod shape-determining protein [bacterium]
MQPVILRKYFGIDLGTDSTLIYLKGLGVVVNEPSIIAFNNRTNKIVAVGTEAKKMLSRTPAHIAATRPISHGIIADFDITKAMLEFFLKNKKIPWSWLTEAIVSVPTNLTEVERKSVEDLLKEVGANKVYIIEQPLAAAIGSHLDINHPTAYLMVDIGAGTTDMAVVSMNGVVISNRLKIAGNRLNNDIIRAIKEEFKLYIGEPTAEEIKITVGSAIPQSERLEIAVRGREVNSGLPGEMTIKDTNVRLWLQPALKQLVEGVKDLIEATPPELVGDIYKNGLFLCGGGSLLRGIDTLFHKELGINVKIVDEPLSCIVRGTGLIAEKFNDYKYIFNNFSKIKNR